MESASHMPDMRPWSAKFLDVLEKTSCILGDRDYALKWLRSPAIGLDQRRPIDLIQEATDQELLHDFLGRIDYGVYC